MNVSGNLCPIPNPAARHYRQRPFGPNAVLIALAGFFGEEGLEFALHALIFVGIGRRITADRNIGPFFGEFGVDLEPFFQPVLSIRQNRLGRTFGFANAAVDAFAGIDDQHIVAFVKAVHRTHFDTVHIFAFDTVFGNNVGHLILNSPTPAHNLETAEFVLAIAQFLTRQQLVSPLFQLPVCNFS
ncbi:hypothetical protein SPHINGOR109_50255 [Sphingorhabdus sp. 109]|nr:hypothetical protein SPHINGOR109_50255 [Sphingorhabdus sp. 109]